jgi:DNA-binding CsgD family transcriptional regulator
MLRTRRIIVFPDPSPRLLVAVESNSTQLEAGRQAFERQAWKAAHEALRAARDARSLVPADLWRLAIASYLIGHEDDFVHALQEGHQAHADTGDRVRAARFAFWLGFHMANRGEVARATGWFGRATRLLDEAGGDTAERGYLLLPAGHQMLGSGDYEAALRAATEAATIGQRFRDADLLALAVHLQGRCLLRLEKVESGLGLLDEAMVAVSTGEVSPHVSGLIYCSVIGACREVYALRRAHEWTSVLAEWCARQPDMVPYAGECRLYRAEILQLHGKWGDAFDEARRASEHLASSAEPGASGLAFYQLADMHRLRGDLAAAEATYRASARWGREPQPGLALLRLAQGDRDGAAAAIRQALAGTGKRLQRARLLPACIDIALEAGDLGAASDAFAELESIALAYGTGVLRTLVAQASGAIELARGHATAALAPLREASRDWLALDAPYEAARVGVLVGLACRALGDDSGAEIELDAARSVFERLGAVPDVARVDALLHRRSDRDDHGLTPREREVLALLVTGRTNRAIAAKLFISEKTVARHVANIFGKLGVTSRAAATAFAYQHELLDPSA